MERFMEGGRDRNKENMTIAFISAETELATSLVSLTLDLNELTRRDV